MKRRQWIVAAPLLATAPLALTGCSGELKGFGSLADARKAADAVTPRWRGTGTWNVAEVFNHLAQSIEYSMSGFPQARSRWYRYSVGIAAFAYFNARGQMTHPLDQPLPGAPSIGGTFAVAKARLLEAIDAFESFKGELKPHFTYGSLSREQYARAHLMHLQNHWSELAPT